MPLRRNRQFARLWFIQASTQVGGNMALFAMTVLVFDTTRSNSTVSALLATYVLPQILLSPFAGVIVDRLDLRWALLGPNVVRAILMAGLALAGADVPILLALNLGVSLTSVALTPAEGSMIPRVVPVRQLETAMGIFNLTLQGSFAVGFAFAGPLLVTIAGPSAVLGVVTALYIAAAVACIGLPSHKPAERSGASRRDTWLQPLRDLRDGFATVRHDREISRPIIHLAAAASIAGVLGVLGPALALTIGLEPDQLAVVVVPLGIGVILGVFGLRRFGGGVPRRRAAEIGLIGFGGLTTLLGVLAAGAQSITYAGLPLLPAVVVIAFIAGAAYAITSVSAQTGLLESIPEDVRGRVFGVLASVVSAASLAPTLVAGPLADRVSAPAVLVLVGVAVVVFAIWSNRLFGPLPSKAVDSARPRSS